MREQPWRRHLRGRQLLGPLLMFVVVAAGAERLGSELRVSGPELDGPPDIYTPIFPRFSMGSTVSHLDIRSLNADERLLAISLQGLVNRESARIYLDSGSPWDVEMLAWIGRDPAIRLEPASLDGLLAAFRSSVNGTVIYDPAAPETINLATSLAGLCGCVMANPAMAESLATSGFAVKRDLRDDALRGRTPRETYERSLEALFNSAPATATILHPGAWRSRDYALATGSFVFFYEQGPLVAPSEVDAMETMMARLPHGMPVLGWFPTPTRTEENFALQIMSRHGKHLIGAADMPNLSILGALGVANLKHPTWTGQAPALEEGSVYLSFAIPDGDNLDFMQRRMFELWQNRTQAQGLPLGWSLPPALVEIAPGLIDYFYSKSTDDSFIAGPSGAGYVYPDFLPEDDLRRFLGRTSHLLQQADLDTIWLLNSFTSYEVPYSERVLSAYAALQPRGLILDYADAPVTRTEWMQPGGAGGAPVVRAYHLWSTVDNLVSKVRAHIEAKRGQTSFVIVALYPYTHDLTDLPQVADRIEALFPGRLRIVSPPAIMDLVEEHAIRVVRRDAATGSHPLSLLSPLARSSAEAHVKASFAAEALGDWRAAAVEADLAGREMRRAEVEGGLVSLGISLAAVPAIGSIHRRIRKRPPERPAGEGSGPSGAFHAGLAPTIVLFSFALLFGSSIAFEAQRYFWDYYGIVAALPAGFLAGPLERRLRARLGGRSATLALGALTTISSVTLLWHSLAFVGVTLGFVGLAGSLLELRNRSNGERAVRPVALAMMVSASVGIVLLAGPSAPLLLVCSIGSILGLLLVSKTAGYLPASAANAKRGPRDRLTTTTAALLSMGLLPLLAANTGSFALRLDLHPATLAAVCGIAGMLGAAACWVLSSAVRGGARLASTLAAIAVSALVATMALDGPALIIILALAVAASLGASVVLQRIAAGMDRRVLVLKLTLFLTLGYVFARLPPISYSLYVTPLPSMLEHALYVPTIIIAMLLIVLALRVLRPARLTTRREE